jgi:hypothetical protein
LKRETIHLRLGEGVGAAKFDWILSRYNEEKLGKAPAGAFHRNLLFRHCFEQSRLRARRSAVNLICQQDVCEDGTFVIQEPGEQKANA